MKEDELQVLSYANSQTNENYLQHSQNHYALQMRRSSY